MMRFLRATALVVAMGGMGGMGGTAVALAQCRPPAGSHEARLLAFYEVPAVFSTADAPERLPSGALSVGAELSPVPSPDPALTHPQYCYQNTTNDTRLAPIFGRPRVVVGLPAGFAIEGSWLPPVTVARARATLASVALSRTQALAGDGSPLALSLRVHGTLGRVRGAITCPRGNLQTTDPGAPCYGTQPSSDHFEPNSWGLESAVGVRLGAIAAYAGGGANWEYPHFQAGFTDAAGIADHTTVDVALVRGTAFGGATIGVRGDLAASGEVYAVPRDGALLRFGLAYRVH